MRRGMISALATGERGSIKSIDSCAHYAIAYLLTVRNELLDFAVWQHDVSCNSRSSQLMNPLKQRSNSVKWEMWTQKATWINRDELARMRQVTVHMTNMMVRINYHLTDHYHHKSNNRQYRIAAHADEQKSESADVPYVSPLRYLRNNSHDNCRGHQLSLPISHSGRLCKSEPTDSASARGPYR
jgi:hypothetical protein